MPQACFEPWIDATSSTKCGVQPEVAGVVRGGADNSQGSGRGASAIVGVGAAGNVEVKALIRNYADAIAVGCSGQVTVVFFATP